MIRYALLSSLFLLVALARADTPVQGTIPTSTWTHASSPYRVQDTVLVPLGEALTIEAGVDVLFDADVPFIVQGSIRADGTESDSVRFLPGASHQAGGIDILGTDSSSLRYARVSGGVDRDKFGKGGGIVIGSQARLAMYHCVISGNSATGQFGKGGGIYAGGESRLLLTDCTIADNRAGCGGGVYVHGAEQAVVKRCRFVSNSAVSDSSWARGGGLYVGWRGWQPGTDLFQCVFYQNVGAEGAAIYTDAELTVTNCTIAKNVSDGDHVADIAVETYSPVTVTNSIFFANAGNSISQHDCSDNLKISYCSFGTIWPLTRIVCEYEGSFKRDPRFITRDGNPFALGPDSPCIDAGSPYMLDEDGTRSDMGATGGGVPNPAIPRFESGATRLSLSRGETGSLHVWNSGWANLEVSVSPLPEGFSTSTTFPQTVAAGEHLSIPITFSGAGNVVGTCTVSHSDIYRPAAEVQLYGLQGTVVSGSVRGTWSKANSPYRVVEPVVVEGGDSLTIEPGVDVLFDRNAGLTVEGVIRAVGTETDSIRFLRGVADSWTGILLSGMYYPDSAHIQFGYVRISGGSGGLHVVGGPARNEVSVVHSVVSGVHGTAVYIWGAVVGGATVELDRCTIVDNETEGEGGGIEVSGRSDALRVTVTRSVISRNRAGGSGGGLCLGGSAEVRLDSCVISHNSAGSSGGGISVGSDELSRAGQTLTLTVANCTIVRNSAPAGGYAVGVSTYGGTPVELTNCTVADNAGGGVHSWSGSLVLTSCIVWNNPPLEVSLAQPSENPIPPIRGDQEDASVSVTYSDIKGGWEGEGNIDAAPLFVDAENGDYRLQPGSPAISAGDPNAPPDVYGTPVDMGAIPFDRAAEPKPGEAPEPPEPPERPATFALEQSYPNPFNAGTTIRFSVPAEGIVNVAIYDVNGRRVRTLVNAELQPGDQTVLWDGRDQSGRAVASGVYLVRLECLANRNDPPTNSNEVRVRRVTLLR